MSNVIEYKGYFTKVEYSSEDQCLYGKIEGIVDFVNFECDKLEEAEAAFQEAVEDYLAFCRDLGKEPNKTYKGVFNVRVSEETHRAAALAAAREGVSFNQFIANAIRDRIECRA